MTQKPSNPPNRNPFPISVDIRPGRGDAAFLANVHLGDFITIYDFPVWKGKEGILRPALPAKTVRSERNPVVEIQVDLRKRIFEAIQAVCEKWGNESSSMPR